MNPISSTLYKFSAAIMVIACIGIALPAAAQQAAYPNRPVKLLVGASAGGAPDMVARQMAKVLADSWGQTLIIENKPGVAGMLAADQVSKAPNDGYEIGILLDSVIVNLPFLNEKMPFNTLTDLNPIAMVASFPLILIANPNQKFKTLKEFLAEAKANPGKINYGSSGLGSSVHLAMEVLQRSAGVQVTHVPYKGGIPALQDVVAGHVPLMWSSVSAAMPLLKSGKVIALGIGSQERFPLLPDVPTVAEQGFSGFSASNWLGIFGPAAMSEAAVRKLRADFAMLTRIPAYREALLGMGIEPQGGDGDGDRFAKLIRADYARNKSLFSALGLGPK